jgi:hypothetical protein
MRAAWRREGDGCRDLAPHGCGVGVTAVLLVRERGTVLGQVRFPGALRTPPKVPGIYQSTLVALSRSFPPLLPTGLYPFQPHTPRYLVPNLHRRLQHYLPI